MYPTNAEKEAIILKGFVSKSDIRKLMNNAPWEDVCAVFNKIQADIIKEKKIPHKTKVRVCRVLAEIETSEEEIHRYAEIERRIKKDASPVERVASHIDNSAKLSSKV